MGSKAKGSAKERELRRAFEDEGWFAIRSPGSRGGYDLVAAKDGHVLVMEMKYVEAGEKVYFSETELFDGDEATTSLREAAGHLDAHPYAVVRWKRDTTFYGLPLPLLDATDGGTPTMAPDDREHAIELPPDLGLFEDENDEDDEAVSESAESAS